MFAHLHMRTSGRLGCPLRCAAGLSAPSILILSHFHSLQAQHTHAQDVEEHPCRHRHRQPPAALCYPAGFGSPWPRSNHSFCSAGAPLTSTAQTRLLGGRSSFARPTQNSSKSLGIAKFGQKGVCVQEASAPAVGKSVQALFIPEQHLYETHRLPACPHTGTLALPT